MPIFSEGIVLPAPSRADRKIQNASKWHCTTHAVRGAGPGTRMQGESKLEMDHQSLQFAQPDVADVVEQALFEFGWRNEKRHFFDMVVTKTSGERGSHAQSGLRQDWSRKTSSERWRSWPGGFRRRSLPPPCVC